MIELLDYILDENDNFWIVNNISDVPKGYIVYKRCSTGRFNNITKLYYKRTYNEPITKIPDKYKQIFKPHPFYLNHKQDLQGIWKAYVEVLNEIGIEDNDIGIFGSYLIGFDISKDVDFVIYGVDNLKKYYKYNDYIKDKLKASYIDEKHILNQYQKHYKRFPKECELKEIIARNWSGIMLENNVLSTPRFIDTNNSIIPKKEGIDMEINVKVLDGLTSTLLPRITKVLYNNDVYTIISSIWKYQSFAKKDDDLIIYANVDHRKKLIIIDEDYYYIKFKHKGHLIT